MTQFNGRQIRSKHTYQKGKILEINENYVAVTFIEEENPIYLTHQQFIDNCLFDESILEILKSCDTSHNNT